MLLSRDRILQILFQRVAQTYPDPGKVAFLAHEIVLWPNGTATALERAGLFEQGQPAEGLVCTGCEDRCFRSADVVEDGGEQVAISTCALFPNRGPFRNPISRLARFIATRKRVAQYFAKQVGWRLPHAEGTHTRFRFGTQQIGNDRRTVMLEFNDTARVCVGGLPIPLADLILWRGDSPVLDRKALELMTHTAPDLQSGGKRTQPSSAVQKENKTLTAIRNDRWQREAEQLQAMHPRWNKDRIAQEIAKTSQNKKVEWTTILRIIRLAKK